MKAIITFTGGPECGDVGSTTWGNGETGTIKFPLREPVLVDSDSANGDKRKFLEHLITKARVNRFFTVEDAKDGAAATATAAVVQERKPEPRLKPNPKRGEAPAKAP